jgi:hypothetical protein
MYVLDVMAEAMQTTPYAPVRVAIRKKEVPIGKSS